MGVIGPVESFQNGLGLSKSNFLLSFLDMMMRSKHVSLFSVVYPLIIHIHNNKQIFIMGPLAFIFTHALYILES